MPFGDHFACQRIDGDALVFEDRFRPSRGAPQQGADTRQQFVEIIRFQDVIVGARVEAGDALLDGVARRGHEDRRVELAQAHRAQHVEAILARQAQVQQHQVIGLRLQGRIGHVAILDPVHRVMLGAQQIEHHFADHRIVFYQQ
ncbi:hypothetical protein D3C72_1588480 [compost metagenome]